MGCEGGELTSDNIEMLELLEDKCSYPPRFRLQFKLEENVIDARSQNVTVRFNGVHPPTTDTIVLEKAGMYIVISLLLHLLSNLTDSKRLSLPLTPAPSSSSSSASLDHSVTDTRWFSKGMNVYCYLILFIITASYIIRN